ncbi:MAG: Bro-N domain-containing protein [Paludibacteraceae bacterium]|nr:Bro-N domain-containing protein [Paludibacteraceae bacterium]
MENDSIKLFESKQIRTAWDEEQEKWYFSVVDVIEVLTDTDRPRKYWSDLKSKLQKEGSELSAKIGQLKLQSSDGKKYLTDVADSEQLLRLIQSVPSKKAEPFKLWLARIGRERLDQLQDPELSIQQALRDYKRLGYSDNWINQRLKSIEIRKDLTDQWDQHGVKDSLEYATLTDIIYQAWAGKSAKEYKKFKGLKKENLRDNMTNEELVLNMLAELSTTSITRSENPSGLKENMDVAARGGKVARVAREELEAQTGKKVVSPLSAKRFFENQKPTLPFEEDQSEDQLKDEDKDK